MINKIIITFNLSLFSRSKILQRANLLNNLNEIYNSKILNARKEIVLYLIFGVFTTLVNILSYLILAKIFGINNFISNVMAWFLSIIFAYVTNRIFVFESKNENILHEFSLFIVGRGLSGILDSLLFYTLVILLMFDDVLSKIVINIIVIILNYVFSKWIVFKEK
ncbi:MAG TPA: GtrA family protein [Methanobacterium sp.]|nr:GtrA family protein [Methanobacterium sp.]